MITSPMFSSLFFHSYCFHGKSNGKSYLSVRVAKRRGSQYGNDKQMEGRAVWLADR